MKWAWFLRYVAVDYSGAQTPTSSLQGLRVYAADGASAPAEVNPPPGLKKYWTRRGVAEWLVRQLSANGPALVGIDHGFSFPLDYFERHGLPHDWPSFLDDFQRHWPTDGDHVYVDFVRDGIRGNGAARQGDSALAPTDRTASRGGEVGLPLRRPGLGGQVHALRSAVAAVPPPPTWRPCSLLAV